MDKQEQVGGVITFRYFPIETAPKDRKILAWWPQLGRWQETHWRGHPSEESWWLWDSFHVIVFDQPTHWAELSAMAPIPSPSEPQAPSTTSHQTENGGSTTGLEKGGD